MHHSIVTRLPSPCTHSDSLLDAHGLDPIWSATVQALKESRAQQDIWESRRLAYAMQRIREQGMTEAGLAQLWEMSPRRVRRCLRYARFLTATGCPMSESSFWRYWIRVRDPALPKAGEKEGSAYEAEVFQRIADLYDSGIPAMPHTRRRGPLPPERLAQTRQPLRILQRNLTRMLGEELLPAVRELRPLLHASRATWAPDQVARVAASIDRSVQHVLTYLDTLGTSLHDAP